MNKRKIKGGKQSFEDLIGIWEDAAILFCQLMFLKPCQLMLDMFYVGIQT